MSTLQEILSWAASTNNNSEIIVYFYEFIESKENQDLLEEFLHSNLSIESLFSILRVFIALMQKSAFKITFLKYALSNAIFDKLIGWIRFFEDQENDTQRLSILMKFYSILICNFSLSNISCEQILALLNMICSLVDQGLLTCEAYLYQNILDLKDHIERKLYIYENNIFLYTELDIFPSQFNLFVNNPVIPNKIDGPYLNSEQYLDIQFKLLHADFFSALKTNWLDIKNKNAERSPNFNIYRNVKSSMVFSSSYCSFRLCHKLKLSLKDELILRNENWDTTKKLMTGSLLLFTQNDFETFFVGVLERNFIALSKGNYMALHVFIIGNPYQLEIGAFYDMAEPKVFFEPYFQSMSVLKSINPQELPLADDIVTLGNQIIPSQFSNNWMGFNNLTNDLNESQMNAASAALQQKFTLIQGPPGTGKSYVTQEIIRILAEDKTDNRPVVLICMRNRSLDRVLEPLAKSGLKTIRFGCTENEFLKDFTFFKWKMAHKKVRNHEKSFITECLNKFERDIKNAKLDKKPNLVTKFLDLHIAACKTYKLSKDYCLAFEMMSSKLQLIGATTTGAAKRHTLISQINPKAVIIEEAAEILEANLISSIPLGSNHIIFVGDHLQLQPSPSTHKMSQMYKMDVSLFERLIKNGKSYHCLTVQHRMRPEIAELICPLFYDNLTNHSSVYEFPDIVGIGKNVYFIHHSKSQSCTIDTFSYSNPYEANFLLSLANYLLKQGYSASEITILAAYSAQMNYLIENKDKYRSIMEVQIETIDNYQGDENDIILMSLVRSKSSTIGFLKRPNRINVALSRARKGLYIIGNANTLSKHSEIWTEILELLKSKDSFGSSFPLKCKTHGNVTAVSSHEEIDSLELGGCKSLCTLLLPCGHPCKSKCHTSLIPHFLYLCEDPCNRKVCDIHYCKKKCFEECGDCPEPHHIKLECGHTAPLDYSSNLENYQCTEPCKRKVCDFHYCKKKCFEECGNCPELHHIDLECGHTAPLEYSSNLENYQCKQPCERLPCGFHKCTKLCYEKCISCKKYRKFLLECGHTVYLKCTIHNICDINYICQKQCKRKPCGYHRCENKCSEPCGPCRKLTMKNLPCGHYSQIPCSQDIASYRCVEPCMRSTCDFHFCSKLCYEPCGPCLIRRNIRLNCGHTAFQICSLNVSAYKCTDICRKKRRNCYDTHYCKYTCHRGECPPCIEKVYIWRQCGHHTTKICYLRHLAGVCEEIVRIKYPQCPHYYNVMCAKTNIENNEKCKECSCTSKSVLIFLTSFLLVCYFFLK